MVRKLTALKYGLGGTAFGCMFPIVAITADALYITPGKSLFELVAASPLHWIILLAPFVLGPIFFWLGRYVARLADENARRARLENELREAAFQDALTGLANRAALISHLRASHGSLAGLYLVLIDLDRFKFVNDTMGHGAGDLLLAEVAGRLRDATGKEGCPYRLGGDEFLVLLEPCTAEKALALGLAFKEAISTTYDLELGHIFASASIGIAPIEPGDDDGSVALVNADLALYEAKAARASVVFYDSAMSCKAKERLGLELDLRDAVAKGQFYLEFQPIVLSHDGHLAGFEALVRWQHPTRGIVPPLHFIPVAESSGLIIPIGQWVLNAACEAASRWPAHIGLSVNVSVEQLKDSRFPEDVQSCLTRWDIAPHRLTLEVTESLFILDAERVGALIGQLRGLGVRIALDDFGTGYSSINHLRSFAFDQIKIDKSFARAMTNDSREQGLVKTIVQLSAAFSIPATIEGIETQTELDLARSVGIDFAQGYFFARPMSAQRVSDYIASDQADIPLATAKA